MSTIQLAEAIMTEAGSFGFDELANFIDLPTDTTEVLKDALDNMSEDEMRECYEKIIEFKEAKEMRKTRIKHNIALNIQALIKRVMLNPSNMQELIADFSLELARKLTK